MSTRVYHVNVPDLTLQGIFQLQSLVGGIEKKKKSKDKRLNTDKSTRHISIDTWAYGHRTLVEDIITLSKIMTAYLIFHLPIFYRFGQSVCSSQWTGLLLMARRGSGKGDVEKSIWLGHTCEKQANNKKQQECGRRGGEWLEKGWVLWENLTFDLIFCPEIVLKHY